MEATNETPLPGLLNESAIKDHALECSRRYRAAKFKRVGQDFIDEVKTDVEVFIRKLRGERPTLHPTISHSETVSNGFVKGALIEKVAEELDNYIARVIQNKVQAQPTVGVTLGRTR